MVARQLFDACWDSGLVLVATSNRPPEALYEGGPNRQYFSPFVTRSATRRGKALQSGTYAIDARRLHQTRSWVVFFSILSRFGHHCRGESER